MVTVAMVYNPVPQAKDRWADPEGRTPRFNVPLRGGIGRGSPALGEPLRRQAAHQVGMDRARRWIALSDGGAGLEDWLRTNFGRVDAVILDFYHATEYLGDLGRALHPVDEGAREAWLGDWCHRLKHEGGSAVLEGLRELKVPGRAARETLANVVRYFTNQSHRMDYPTYVAKGWAIGSGPVESACKTVIGQRMKGSGMRHRARTAPTASAIFARCSKAATNNGMPIGTPPKTSSPTYKSDA